MEEKTKNAFALLCVVFAIIFFLSSFVQTMMYSPIATPNTLDLDIAVRLRATSHVIIGIFWLVLAFVIKHW